MPSDTIIPVPRQADAQGFYIHCNGGFRAAEVEPAIWMIEPVLHEGRACRVGLFDRPELDALMRKTGIAAIAFQQIVWRKGAFQSSWSPLIPGRQNHMRGPSDLWASVSSNLARSRTDDKLRKIEASSHEYIAAIIDARTREEWLARSISLSLRSADICVEQIADFYNEQLINLMTAGLIDGRRFGGLQDQRLFAFVHAFFLHLGTARDYLASLIALRLNKNVSKIDSLASLVKALQPHDVGTDALLDLLLADKLICAASSGPTKFETSGWLRQATDLRNKFVHRRPYGSNHLEQLGYLSPVAPELGIFRYIRPVVVEEGAQQDIFDVIVFHYKKATALFQTMAEASGKDMSMLTLSDQDIISVGIEKN